jgi:hypothetical protein
VVAASFQPHLEELVRPVDKAVHEKLEGIQPEPLTSRRTVAATSWKGTSTAKFLSMKIVVVRRLFCVAGGCASFA